MLVFELGAASLRAISTKSIFLEGFSIDIFFHPQITIYSKFCAL